MILSSTFCAQAREDVSCSIQKLCQIQGVAVEGTGVLSEAFKEAFTSKLAG